MQLPITIVGVHLNAFADRVSFEFRLTNATRWNSQRKMVRSVVNVPEDKLKDTVRPLPGPVSSRTFTTLERTLLNEFVAIMESIEEATNCIQGEDRVTMLNVIPSIRGLRHKLESMESTYCKPLIADLLLSIKTRLSKYEANILYNTGALDPQFRLQWCQ